MSASGKIFGSEKTFKVFVKSTISLLLFTVFLGISTATAQFSGGTGTLDDPYQIATAAHLNYIDSNPDLMDKSFILIDDIDLTGVNFNIIGGFMVRPFEGVFDGQGHKISNLHMDTYGRYYVGMFGYIKGAEIKNLGLEDIEVSAPDCNWVGGLAGHSDGYSTISSCYVTGNVSGLDQVGMFVGCNIAIITDCYCEGNVSGNRLVGGLIGENGGSIINCYSRCVVSGNEMVGGLLGYGGRVTNSFWDIETSGLMTSAGGFGRTTAQMKTADNYIGWNSCGDEVVWILNESNDYPRLAWEAKLGRPLPQQKLADCLEGDGTQDNPYQVSTGRQLNMIGLFPCEWDKHFVLTDDIDLADYSVEFNIIGNEWINAFRGVFDGQEHKIVNFTWHGTNQNCVGLFRYVGYWGGEIRNLGMETIDVNAPGCYNVGGLVGVNRGLISNCYCLGSVSGYRLVGGLAGRNDKQQSGNTGIITDCYSTGSVSGSGRIGGLIGSNGDGGVITKSYSESNVSGNGAIGGLAGYNGGGSTITNSYSEGEVSGNNNIGGLVGWNMDEGIISDCYSQADVFGSDMVGGLVGDHYGGIFNCYSTGFVSGDWYVGGLVSGAVSKSNNTISGSFWDVETSGQIQSDDRQGLEGLTTSEMQSADTFINAGWDFEDIWIICEGFDYPRLQWQNVQCEEQ